MKKKSLIIPLFLIFIHPFIFSSPLESPTWGFSLDLPEGYEFSGGNGKDAFSFSHPDGAVFEINVSYSAQGQRTTGQGSAGRAYASVEEMSRDVKAKLDSSGDLDFFEYRGKKASLLELDFLLPGAGRMSGWAICVELRQPNTRPAGSSSISKPLLFAMAYGQAGKNELDVLHFSALDSIAPEESDRLAPGPITEYAYPEKTRIKAPVFALDCEAWIFEEDAEAAQALVDREFQVLRRYQNSQSWKEAWIRFYRAVYRDSFERLTDIAFQVERKLNVPPRENRDFAGQALKWVQSFKYERNLFGSDFTNLVSAAIEGRGDCDNRAMLWAVILKQACIPSAMMVSRNFSHAMGLADLPGSGARFELNGQKLLVAETTADVSIGLINEAVSEIDQWLGVLFE
jgi:hypothetical protein